MTIESLLFACLMAAMFVACVLYVAFGQITVRKLRKNPKTKDALGMEYISGWDIINVAQTLAIPRSWSRKLEKSPIASIYANSELLFENTNKFDRLLGAIFYWLLMSSGLSGALLVLLNAFGLFSGTTT